MGKDKLVKSLKITTYSRNHILLRMYEYLPKWVNPKHLPKVSFVTEEDLFYENKKHNFKCWVKKGFVFDGASVPAPARAVIPRSLLEQASALHDALFHVNGELRNCMELNFSQEINGTKQPAIWFNRNVTLKEVNDFFEEDLIASDVPKFYRKLANFFVRKFGWVFWIMPFNPKKVIFLNLP